MTQILIDQNLAKVVRRRRILMRREALSLVTLNPTILLLPGSKFRGGQWSLEGPSLPLVFGLGSRPRKGTSPPTMSRVLEVQGTQKLEVF